MTHSNRRCRGDAEFAIVGFLFAAFGALAIGLNSCGQGKREAFRLAHALPEDAVVERWLGSDDWYAVWKDASGAVHAKWVSKPEAVR